MSLLVTLRIAVRALAKNKMCAALTVLGVVIGIAAVTTMVSIGQSASALVQGQVEGFGTNVIVVIPGSRRKGGVRLTGLPTLTARDSEAIPEECPAVLASSSLVGTGGQVIFRNSNWSPKEMFGVGEDYLTVRNWPLQSGGFFSKRDIASGAKVCVIGHTLVARLFQTENPIDKTIRVRNIPFRIIGVLARKGANMVGDDQDDLILMPHTTVRKRLNGTSFDSVHAIMVSARSPSLMAQATTEIEYLLARIDTERSFFQYKSSVQGLVYGVIEAYWALVSARTDLWAREQQVAQADFANLRTEKRLEVGDANAGDVAQTRLALENFRASLLAAQANLLQREAALRNILGLPPYTPNRIVPVTPMSNEEIQIDWDEIIDLASQQRPDIIELKLILEADEQLLLQSRNTASPRVDAVALYRWNGLEGEMPVGGRVSSRPGQFTDWSLGVNFSVPPGLRRGRAQLRQQELVLSRDHANLEQGMHQAVHLLALSLRNLDQYYQQYKRYQAVRAAAKANLDQQMAQYHEGFIQFIIVLQAIVEWGNAVSSEAQSLAQYNLELAKLEQETGTILESHGIAFYEERYGSLGPLGRLGRDHCYPAAMPPSEGVDRYPAGDRPSEESFDLRDPLEDIRQRRKRIERVPAPIPNTSVLPPPVGLSPN